MWTVLMPPGVNPIAVIIIIIIIIIINNYNGDNDDYMHPTQSAVLTPCRTGVGSDKQ
jgi:hypothetical protein